MLKFLTAGESHGKALIAVIEGLPANLTLDEEFINHELFRRMQGYGRSERMKIERDEAEVISGVANGKTLGSPVSLIIKNRDYENWKDKAWPIVTRPRPGHGDLAGTIKYNQNDIRNVLERASARETAARVAVGAIAKQLLAFFGIQIRSHVISIGNEKIGLNEYNFADLEKADESCVRCIDKDAEARMVKTIDNAKKQGDSLGGVFEVVAQNVPVGLGSHVHWDRKLDGRLAQALMSIQSVKGVEIGLGFQAALRSGSKVHDEIFYENGKGYFRKTNNAGGIEAGISNGNPVVARCAIKPVPTLYKPLRSVDIHTKEPFLASVERSDVCVVPAAGIVGEAAMAWVLAEAMTEKFGGDSIEEMKSNYRAYLHRIN